MNVIVDNSCPPGQNCGGNNTQLNTTGAEGILNVTQGPVSNTVLYVGQSMVPVLSVRAQAQNSDIAIQRITVDLGTNTTIYNKIISKLYVTDGTNVLASVPLNPSTVVQNGNDYIVTIGGFSSVVPVNTYKDFVIKADLFPAIDSTYRNQSWTVMLSNNNPVRGVDQAGIDQYGGSSSISQSFTINASLTDNSIANLSTDPASPQTTSVPVTDTTNGQISQLPVFIFDVGAQNDTLHLHQVQVTFATSSANGAPANANITAAYLYQGSTPISSASVSATGVATFTNIVDNTPGATIPVNTSVAYTIKVDATNVTAGSLTVTPTLNTTNTTIYNSIDATPNAKNGSAVGFATTILGKGPVFALANTPVATVSGTNQSGNTQSTSTITATFNVNLQAVGSAVYFGNQASTSPMFTFKVFNGAGTDVTSTLVSTSSGFIIPNTVVTAGMPSGSFYVSQNNSTQIANVTFQFAGKNSAGSPLTAGPYSVEIAGITYSVDNGATHTTTTYMDGLSAWRTNGVNP